MVGRRGCPNNRRRSSRMWHFALGPHIFSGALGNRVCERFLLAPWPNTAPRQRTFTPCRGGDASLAATAGGAASGQSCRRHAPGGPDYRRRPWHHLLVRGHLQGRQRRGACAPLSPPPALPVQRAPASRPPANVARMPVGGVAAPSARRRQRSPGAEGRPLLRARYGAAQRSAAHPSPPRTPTVRRSSSTTRATA